MKSTKEKMININIDVTHREFEVLNSLGYLDKKEEPQEPQIDWSKVAKGTAVFVSDDLTKEWEEAFFLGHDTTCDKLPFKAINESGEWWKHCKLDKSAPSIINWVKNTGETPNCDMVLARNIDGDIRYILIKSLGFEINYKSIVEYAIIE